MNDFIHSLSEDKVFTMLDARCGYWQVPISDKYQGKTTFTSHIGTYRYKRMPFGFRNGPSIIQRALYIVLSDERLRMCLVNTDTILIFSQNSEEHIDHIEHLLALLEETGIYLKLQKWFFFKDDVEYLGHHIRSGILSVYKNSKATQAVRDALFPQTPTQLRSFLRAANVYQRFVKDYAKMSTPLNYMLKKDKGIIWNELIEPDSPHSMR